GRPFNAMSGGQHQAPPNHGSGARAVFGDNFPSRAPGERRVSEDIARVRREHRVRNVPISTDCGAPCLLNQLRFELQWQMLWVVAFHLACNVELAYLRCRDSLSLDIGWID